MKFVGILMTNPVLSLLKGVTPAIKYIKRDMQRSMKYTLNLTQDHLELKNTYIGEHKNIILPIGIYNTSDNTFRWIDAVKRIVYEHICTTGVKDSLAECIGDALNVEKITPNELLRLMTLISMFNPAFTLTRFSTPGSEFKVYTLIKFAEPSCLPQKKFAQVMKTIDI